MKIYLVRHPRVQLAPGICYGSSDVAVAPAEIERVLPALLTSLPSAAQLFSSPLQRCAGLARQWAAAQGNLSLRLDARLAEMHFGAWELRAWADIPRPEIDAWADDPVSYRPGGGESVLHMLQRVRAFEEEIVSTGQDCVVICHAGTIRLLLASREGGSPQAIARSAALRDHQISYGEVIVLQRASHD